MNSVTEWRRANPERAKASSKDYYERNRERILRYNKERYSKKRDKILEKNKEWRAENRDKCKAKRQRRRSRKKEQFIEDVLPSVVYQMHGGMCGICLEFVAEDEFHVDHVIPLAKGGLHGYINVQPAHPKCNTQKGDRMPTRDETLSGSKET